jgi:FlaG/FlaF family flagellin (archaellin)
MKTIKLISKVTMMIAFVAFANTSMGAENLKVNILPITSETAFVAISNTTISNFQITIENAQGEVVYYKSSDTKSSDFRKLFDFSNFEKGDYKLSVTVGESTTECSLKIGKGNIVVGEESKIESLVASSPTL